MHDELDLTHPSTIGRAISIVEQPPFAHFGWAQRKIIALQFPKSAVGAFAAAPFDRGFMYAFHIALFVAPGLPLNAVKLLPAVVATGVAAYAGVPHNIIANNKNLDIFLIFSLNTNFNIKNSIIKDKN